MVGVKQKMTGSTTIFLKLLITECFEITLEKSIGSSV
jgi:hypothetical protein